MGNGAVFQLVPQRFRVEMGVMTGLVGMTGGVGGFYLASSLGVSRQTDRQLSGRISHLRDARRRRARRAHPRQAAVALRMGGPGLAAARI